MNTLYLLMISGLLMGSVTVTAKGLAYPRLPYLNPMPSSLNGNQDHFSLKRMSFLNEEKFHRKMWSMKALNERVENSRWIEIFG